MATKKYLDEQGLAILWEKIKTKFNDKVDKENGKSLMTDEERNKLATIAECAEKNIIVGVSRNGTLLTPDSDRVVEIDIPMKTSELTNDSTYQTAADVAETIVGVKLDLASGIITLTRKDGTSFILDLPTEKIIKSGRYDNETKEIVLVLEDESEIRFSASELIDEYYADESTLELYTDTADGNKKKFRLKTAYKNKIDGSEQTTNKTASVSASSTSTQYPTALAVYNAVKDLATKVQTFTQANTRANIESGETIANIFGKIKKWFADLKTVAFSGSYNDLSDKPTIGNGTVTVKQGGTTKGSFSMNQTGSTTIELTDNNTTYSTATTSANGLMSASDKSKLDGIANNANKYSLPVATSSALGGVKSGGDITVGSDGLVTVVNDSHTHSLANVTNKIITNLTSDLGTSVPTDDCEFLTGNNAGIDSGDKIYRRKGSLVWDWIKSKIQSGRLYLNKDYYVHGGLDGTSGSTGYIHFCAISVKKTYANEPFSMFISSRNRLGKLTIHLGLGNTTTISSPALRWENYEFTNTTTNLTHKPIWYKYSDSNLYLYYRKSEGYDTMTVTRLEIGQYMYDRLSFSWQDTLVSSNEGLTNITLNSLYDEGGNKVSSTYIKTSNAATKAQLTDGSVTKLGTSTLGSTNKPIYLKSGSPTECNTYAGGTAVTLNGSSKSGSTASFYAPTSYGTANWLLFSNGSNSSPQFRDILQYGNSDGVTFNKFYRGISLFNKKMYQSGSAECDWTYSSAVVFSGATITFTKGLSTAIESGVMTLWVEKGAMIKMDEWTSSWGTYVTNTYLAQRSGLVSVGCWGDPKVYTLSDLDLFVRGTLELTDSNISSWVSGTTLSLPFGTQTVIFNTTSKQTIKNVITGRLENGYRLTIGGKWTPTSVYQDTSTGRFPRWAEAHYYDHSTTPPNEDPYAHFADYIYFNGVWYSNIY